MNTPAISQAADDLIIASEVGSKALYEKKYRRPEWPGGLSGVTVGIGYDLGYATEAKIKKDWGDLLPGSMIDAMLMCDGVTREKAHGLLPLVKNRIDVPWDKGIQVYEKTDIPEWVARVCKAVPGAENLPPDCLGALTSIGYNRGTGGFTTPASRDSSGRYRELRAIRSHVIAGELDLVDDEIRSMKRLWPGANERGLPIRREKEARLWVQGMAARKAGNKIALPTEVKTKPKEDPPPLAPVQSAGKPEAGTGTGGGLITVGSAERAAAAGWDPWIVGGIVVGGLVVTGLAVWAVRHERGQPILARARG